MKTQIFLNILILACSLLFALGCGKTAGVAPSTDNSTNPTTPPSNSPPNPVVITDPVSLNKTSNTSLNITGTCESGATVNLSGADTQSITCIASSFVFTINKSSNGTYNFNINQTNTYGSSSSVAVSWVYDIVAPVSITITSPLSNPYTSGDSSITIAGNCEVGATVLITGDHSASTNCTSGSFAFTNITKNVDGSYAFNITQRDVATNVSQNTVFTWIRDTTIPATPTITNFTDNPHYSNSSPLTVSGACVSGNTVSIAEAGVVLNSTTCTIGNTYSVTVSKVSNGSYSLYVYQTDAVSLNDSANRDFVWVYDSVAPSAPTINTPSSSPVTSSGSLSISGQCEINATVNLTGDDSQSVLCVSGAYSFTINESVDGTYNYSISQTDRALNTSAAVNQQWVKDSSSLPIPTITTPATNPFISNSSQLLLSGTCQTGLTVVLSGVLASDVTSPANSLSTTCLNSSYSYTIVKADGTYNLSLLQTNGVSNSGSVTTTWTKDTVPPNTSLTLTPPATNYSTTADFTFASSESPSTFECSLNGGAYLPCTTPYQLTNLTNGAYTINVKASDQANNSDATPASYAWTQDANNTIALYHFDSVAPMLDSSNYAGAAKNDLTDNSSANDATGKFAEARFMNTTSNFASVADTVSQQTIKGYLTLEAQVQLNALPGNNAYAPIVSKVNTGSSLASFEYGIRKQGGGKFFLYFRGSLNGTTYTEVKSSSLTAAEETALTAGFNHIAVTWSLGSVKFYFNGVPKGTSSIGTVGSSQLASSTAALRVGYNGSFSLNGSVDEVRISQRVRWTTGFTPPASAYTAD